MIKKLYILIPGLIAIVAIAYFYIASTQYGAPPYTEEVGDSGDSQLDLNPYANWVRPDGPIRIGLQAGHWKTDEMPEEQTRIKENGGGTSSQGIAEWEVALEVANHTAELLEKDGYVVDILPATIPEKYWADVFVSIHADGNLNPLVEGYKVAASQRDITKNAQTLADSLDKSYGEIVGFPKDPNITRNMTRYYAFNARRYKHAIHPMTPGVLIELGFMTNYREAKILINNPELPAEAIAKGIINYINR